MARWTYVAGACALAIMAVAGASAQNKALPANFPQWAFPGPNNLSIAKSKQKYSMVTMYDRTRAVDWFPEQHPAMPEAVRGKLPVFACGFCHLPEGAGRSENAALAGMPADYLMRQVTDFKSGARKSADPKFGPAINMIGTLHQLPDKELADAAKYYASLRYTKHLKIVEATTVPHHHADGFVWVIDGKGASEPLGTRIIEGPDNFEGFEMRDPNMTFTAYVPVGSVARGAQLAKGNGGDRPACVMCHGPGLKGGPIGPPIAGRLPTTMFRQLYGFQTGDRNGTQAALMKPVVAKLAQKDMVDLAAYVASLQP